MPEEFENLGDTTLEREKISYCEYKYFFVDREGRKVKDLDEKYYNCKQIGSVSFLASEEVGINETVYQREYDVSFRYFEFSYDSVLPGIKKYIREYIEDDEFKSELLTKTEFDKRVNDLKEKISKLNFAI